jgi:hypothetical protein
VELRLALLHPSKALASEVEVSAVWPGGKENRAKGHAGWIECYASLKSFTRRIEFKQHQQADASLRIADVVKAAAMRTPVPVMLSVGEHLVHPKSIWALSWLDGLDGVTTGMTELLNAASEFEDPETLRMFAPIATALAFRTWAWILTHEGVGLPFGDNNEPIDPPEWTEKLLAEDYLALFIAHRRLHFDAIALMASAMGSDTGPEKSRLGLGGFLTGTGEASIEPSHIARRWSLPESVASGLGAHETQRVAEANAKAKAASGR